VDLNFQRSLKQVANLKCELKKRKKALILSFLRTLGGPIRVIPLIDIGSAFKIVSLPQYFLFSNLLFSDYSVNFFLSFAKIVLT